MFGYRSIGESSLVISPVSRISSILKVPSFLAFKNPDHAASASLPLFK